MGRVFYFKCERKEEVKREKWEKSACLVSHRALSEASNFSALYAVGCVCFDVNLVWVFLIWNIFVEGRLDVNLFLPHKGQAVFVGVYFCWFKVSWFQNSCLNKSSQCLFLSLLFQHSHAAMQVKVFKIRTDLSLNSIGIFQLILKVKQLILIHQQKKCHTLKSNKKWMWNK